MREKIKRNSFDNDMGAGGKTDGSSGRCAHARGGQSKEMQRRPGKAGEGARGEEKKKEC